VSDRVVVALSGGVDSSAAATLLKEQGYEVIGVTMQTWTDEADPDGTAGLSCPTPADEADARRVAQVLGIPFHTVDVAHEFKAGVIDYFRREYAAGRTPNPCIRCNREVKLGALSEKVRSLGIDFDCFATGHYARVEYDASKRRYLLKKAVDTTKDQSYFLFSLSQEQLSRCLFPLGPHTKEEARKIARNLGLGVDSRPESQDFTARGHPALWETAQPGPIMDRHGNVLGEHRGLPYYTIGQRSGLGIAMGERLYVTTIDSASNTVVVGPREDIYSDMLVASELNWVSIEELEQPVEAKAKIRYHHREADAVIAPLEDGTVSVKFAEPQMAIAPGQAVVFYQGDDILGGGFIEGPTANPD
jgi:tRNA-specific 2-thiouridylase